MIAAVLLMLCLVELAYFMRQDMAEYASFKLLTETRDRQRRFLKWVGKSFLLFTGTSLVCLAILGRMSLVLRSPVEFLGLTANLRAVVPPSQLDRGFLIGFGGAVAAGLIGGIVLATVMAKKRKKQAKVVVIGDIAALMPRNAAETWCTALLSLNAGLGEELFFRLLLPLLLAMVIGNALMAFAVAAVIFGLVHRYQGWVGILATTVLGVVFSVLSLWSRSLAAVMCIHAGLDMVGLVVRPTIMRMIERGRGASG